MKVELRHLNRKTGYKYTTGGTTAFDCRETVLQYRQARQVFSNIVMTEVTEWSEWQDVLTVQEEDEKTD